MWRPLRIAQIFWLTRKIVCHWNRLSPQEFQSYLRRQRITLQASHFAHEDKLEFDLKWIYRAARIICPRQACAIGSSLAFARLPSPVHLHFGANRTSQDLLSAHAWTEWRDGVFQMDHQQKYESIWTIDA